MSASADVYEEGRLGRLMEVFVVTKSSSKDSGGQGAGSSWTESRFTAYLNADLAQNHADRLTHEFLARPDYRSYGNDVSFSYEKRMAFIDEETGAITLVSRSNEGKGLMLQRTAGADIAAEAAKRRREREEWIEAARTKRAEEALEKLSPATRRRVGTLLKQ
jgi:hypothetical protein